MDALDILGGLLGGGRAPSGQSSGGQSSGGQSGGQSSGGFGGRILEELLKAGMGRSAAPAPAPAPVPSRQTSRGGSVSHRPVDMPSEASRLEDLLGVATGGRRGQPGQAARAGQAAQSGAGQAAQSGAGQRTAPTASPYRPAPTPSPARVPSPAPAPRAETPRHQPQPPPSSTSSPFPSPPGSGGQFTDQDEAVLLIQAMINGAKGDGKLDDQEQQAILSRVPNDEETINFLRQEFARPLDVREFAWSVPLGMEVQVYTMSLASIQVDTRAETQYLQELAHGLRLDPELCNQIHARYGAPPLF